MAAGLGFKTFTTGEVLTAADVNGYLMQGVLVFASAAARNAAITSPQEGQFAFTKDTNGLWYYDGAAWVASGATGDIEGVTAGVGISGGGTSGTVTITNDMATTITASGDIVVGTGSGTYDNLPIGTTGQILTADTTVSPYKVKWATAGASGLSAASQAEMEAASSNTVAATPANAQYHPSAAKFWVKFNGTGTPAINASYNFTSITDNAGGYYTLNVATDFSSGNYVVLATVQKLSGASNDTTLMVGTTVPTQNAGDFGLITTNLAGTLSDSDAVYVTGFGDQ